MPVGGDGDVRAGRQQAQLPLVQPKGNRIHYCIPIKNIINPIYVCIIMRYYFYSVAAGRWVPAAVALAAQPTSAVNQV